MSFVPQNPDRLLSPFTGLTRAHWVEAGRWLLEGAFRHVPAAGAPLVFPRRETRITYPQRGDPDFRRRCEVMEGVARTLLVAGPLLCHDPDLRIGGHALRDYYAAAILRLAEPDSPDYVGDRAGMVRVWGDRPIQVTCECASLALELTIARDQLWERYSRREKDRIARLFHEWGHARTHPHNWRLFNIHLLAFLQREGYPIDRAVLDEHLRVVRSFDAGDGWYRDGTYFDYYSVWAFQFYGPLWAAWSGYDTHPKIAAAIEASANRLLETYDRFFDRDGHQPMWGRSNIYRFAASAPFASVFFLRQPTVAPGVARRVLSGNLQQFVAREDFRHDGVPALGFYGQFAPLVQPYSCAASPFWFGNACQALALPADHPLWRAREEPGGWDGIAGNETRDTPLDGPGLTLTQHGSTGATEMRTAKVMVVGGHDVLHQYSRLAFNTKFPWQGDTTDGLMAMHYTVRAGAQRRRPNLVLHGGTRGGVFYRRVVYDFAGSFADNPAIDLADFAVPYGLLRCDRLRLAEPDLELALAHYGLPLDVGEDLKVEERTVGPNLSARILAAGGRQLAFVAIRGWAGWMLRREPGLHPEKAESAVLAATSRRPERYAGDPWRIALLLHRCDANPWTDDELWPFAATTALDDDPTREAVEFTLPDGTARRVDFTGLEGRLSV